MGRYYFHVYDHAGVAEDEEGRELNGLDSVRIQAVKGARSIIMEDVRYGLFDLRGRIDVLDEAGELVLTLPFSEAVRIITDESPDREASNPAERP